MRHPNPLKHRPNTNKNKYCSYHKDIGHTTEQCTKLRDEIEYLIERGYLKEYIQNNQLNEKKTRDYPSNSQANEKHLLLRFIHTIIG